MRRVLLPGFWVLVAGAATAVVLAAVAGRPFSFVVGGALACLAVVVVSAMCWDDVGGKTSLVYLLLGKRARAEDVGPDLLVDVQAIEVAGVFAVARDLLVYLRGGTSSSTCVGAQGLTCRAG